MWFHLLDSLDNKFEKKLGNKSKSSRESTTRKFVQVTYNNRHSLPADWNGKVEDHKHGRSLGLYKHVGYKSGCNGGITSLTDSHQASDKNKQSEILQTNNIHYQPQ